MFSIPLLPTAKGITGTYEGVKTVELTENEHIGKTIKVAEIEFIDSINVYIKTVESSFARNLYIRIQTSEQIFPIDQCCLIVRRPLKPVGLLLNYKSLLSTV